MILYDEFWEKCIVGQGGSVNPPSWHAKEDGYIYRSGLDVEVNLVTRGDGVSDGWLLAHIRPVAPLPIAIRIGSIHLGTYHFYQWHLRPNDGLANQ